MTVLPTVTLHGRRAARTRTMRRWPVRLCPARA